MYKKKFADKYQSRLENVPVEKLEKVLVKIEAHTEKFKNNAEISAEKKENILAQLGAIADMIKEIVDGTDS
jgi:heme oxygenase